MIEDSEFSSKEAYWIDTFHKIMRALQDFTTEMKWENFKFKEEEGQDIERYLEEILLQVKEDR